MPLLNPLSRAPSTHIRSLARVLLSCLPTGGDRLRRLNPAIHARATVAGRLDDLFLTNLLLRGYSNLGRLRDARHLFDRMPHRNLVSWGSVISMYTQHGRDDCAISLFVAFQKASCEVPNEFLLASVLRACTQSKAVSLGEQVHGIAVKLDLDANVYVGTALINLYAKLGCMDEAMLVFHALPTGGPGAQLLGIRLSQDTLRLGVVEGYAQIGCGGVAVELFDSMGI